MLVASASESPTCSELIISKGFTSVEWMLIGLFVMDAKPQLSFVGYKKWELWREPTIWISQSVVLEVLYEYDTYFSVQSP